MAKKGAKKRKQPTKERKRTQRAVIVKRGAKTSLARSAVTIAAMSAAKGARLRPSLAKGPGSETAEQAFERLNQFNGTLRGMNNRFGDPYSLYSVSYRRVDAAALDAAAKRLGRALPEAYVRLLTSRGLPVLDYQFADGRHVSNSFPKCLLSAPGDLRVATDLIDEDEDLGHVPPDQLAAVLDRLGTTIAVARPDPGADDYLVVASDGSLQQYRHDEIFAPSGDAPRSLDAYFSAHVTELNQEQLEFL
jgi:hypothetical protein